jgi:hypothetical protein
MTRAWEYWSTRLDKVEGAAKPARAKAASARKQAVKRAPAKKRRKH